MAKKITKKEMIDVIEKSGMVVNFSRSYYEHRPTSYTERTYQSALAYMERNKGE